MAAVRVTQRERGAILSSLGAGVVPRIGLHHVQVGRKAEVGAVLQDLQRVADGSSAVRFIVGRFGSGKSFFLNLVQTVAMERKLVVARADITTERRLHASGGQARSLYGELMKNLATRGRPEGGALSNLVERWVGDVAHGVTSAGKTDADVPLRAVRLETSDAGIGLVCQTSAARVREAIVDVLARPGSPVDALPPAACGGPPRKYDWLLGKELNGLSRQRGWLDGHGAHAVLTSVMSLHGAS